MSSQYVSITSENIRKYISMEIGFSESLICIRTFSKKSKIRILEIAIEKLLSKWKIFESELEEIKDFIPIATYP